MTEDDYDTPLGKLTEIQEYVCGELHRVCAMEDMKNEAEAEVKKFREAYFEEMRISTKLAKEAFDCKERFKKTQELIEKYCREECEYYETCIPLGNSCPLMIFREQWGLSSPSALKEDSS